MKSYMEIDEFGNKYYKNKAYKFHNENGPAIEYSSGDKEYWVNGKRHKEDGPAVEYSSGDKEYYINGRELTQEQFKKYILKKRLKELI